MYNLQCSSRIGDFGDCSELSLWEAKSGHISAPAASRRTLAVTSRTVD